MFTGPQQYVNANPNNEMPPVIDQHCSIFRKTTYTTNIYMVPEKYKADTSLEYCFSNFDEVSDWNGWSNKERAQQLRFSRFAKYDKALKCVPECKKI